MLELIEEAFDKVALAVGAQIERPRGLAIGFGRHDRNNSALGEDLDERIGVDACSGPANGSQCRPILYLPLCVLFDEEQRN